MSELGKINKMNYNFAKEKDRSKVINASLFQGTLNVSLGRLLPALQRGPLVPGHSHGSATPEQPCRQDLEVACFFFSSLF